MDRSISKGIEDFLGFLRDTEQLSHMAQADAQDAEGLMQDILHALEFGNYKYHEYAKEAKELQKTRKARRVAFDTVNVVAPVVRWIDGSRHIIKELEKLLGEVRKLEKATENRIYTPKVRKKKQ